MLVIEISRNVNYVNHLKLALKNSWTDIQWTYFWRVSAIRNHCESKVKANCSSHMQKVEMQRWAKVLSRPSSQCISVLLAVKWIEGWVNPLHCVLKWFLPTTLSVILWCNSITHIFLSILAIWLKEATIAIFFINKKWWCLSLMARGL